MRWVSYAVAALAVAMLVIVLSSTAKRFSRVGGGNVLRAAPGLLLFLFLPPASTFADSKRPRLARAWWIVRNAICVAGVAWFLYVTYQSRLPYGQPH